ncbi:MAG: DUF371 domain-containing protein [Candidatus Bathyarchaeia archaeon]
MKIIEIIEAYGHENVLSTHKTTFEITKETKLTKRGNCIIAVNANKSASELNQTFKKAIKRENTKITIIIEAGGIAEIVEAYGSPKLQLTHPTDLVIRKSNYICNRTVAINANKAAKDLQPALVKKLQNPKQKIKIKLETESL